MDLPAPRGWTPRNIINKDPNGLPCRQHTSLLEASRRWNFGVANGAERFIRLVSDPDRSADSRWRIPEKDGLATSDQPAISNLPDGALWAGVIRVIRFYSNCRWARFPISRLLRVSRPDVSRSGLTRGGRNGNVAGC